SRRGEARRWLTASVSKASSEISGVAQAQASGPVRRTTSTARGRQSGWRWGRVSSSALLMLLPSPRTAEHSSLPHCNFVVPAAGAGSNEQGPQAANPYLWAEIFSVSRGKQRKDSGPGVSRVTPDSHPHKTLVSGID